MNKVIFAWPPMDKPKGYITAGQNRQVSWLKQPFFAYPINNAVAATMLAQAGQAVTWLDGISDEMDMVEFARVILTTMPDYMVFESPTPLIKRYWEVINNIKETLPQIKIILCGEHVTALPQESRDNCKADFIVTGGDWKYQVFRIITGTYWPEDKTDPRIDRGLTKWWLYAYKNGNFKYLPGTYIMSALDCWHGKCAFCSWATYHNKYKVRPVEDVLAEIEMLIENGIKEIFDDSGTLPVGDWMHALCKGIIERGYNEYVTFGANMRFGALQDDDFALLKQAGFRMILWGFESANQETLDYLQKGYKVKDVMHDLIRARAAGLNSHLTVMFGYYWETYQEQKRTYDMARYLMRKGWAGSAQATICIPYPITPLWKECKELGMLTSENWDDYDQTKAIMRVPFPEKELFKFQQGIYNMAFNPEFLMRKLLSVRDMDDLKYYLRIGRKVYDRFGNWTQLSKKKGS
jgi:radical SAM superfamily enzyme YgiQ (UPF0313 family)